MYLAEANADKTMQHFHNMITKVMPDVNYGCTGFSFMFTQICEKISRNSGKKTEKNILGIILHIILIFGSIK